jgi:hypothetical protein
MKTRCAFVHLLLVLLVLPLQAQVVINEIFYHAPDDLTNLQWIELYNNSDQAVNLSGWRLRKGIKFDFAPGSTIAPRGFIVICKDKKLFQEFYQVTVAGEFGRSLKRSGDRLELRNRDGKLIDSVEFGNRSPWPRAADGWTASLERICPTAPGNLAENWTGSPLSPDDKQPGGTPGDKNAAFCASLPPVISQVSFPTNWIAPEQPIPVAAQVQSKAELKEVVLRYRIVRPGSIGEEQALPMTKSGADARFSASIPGQQAGQIIRFRIQAVDQNSAERFYPSPTEPYPALSCLVFTNVTPGKIAFGYLIHTDADDARSALRLVQNVGRGAATSPEGQARFMAQMQFRSTLDLPSLWAALTLSTNAPADLEKLRPVFSRQERERDLLEQKALADDNPEEIARKIPELIKPFKDTLGESLKPLLTPEQMSAYEAWRDGGPNSPGPGGGPDNAARMLRQFIRLEPDYLHLATITNITAPQLVAVREIYRDAIQQRDALIPDVQKMMSNQREERQAEGEKLQTRALAIPVAVEKKLKQTLTPAQARQFSAWQAAEQPSFMRHSRKKPTEPALGQCAFVYVDPQTREPQLFDFVHIPERSGGWKVHFGKDHPWNGMTVIDLIFEESDRWLLAESLAYDFHRRAGLAACRTDFLRLHVDGQPAGYYLLIEQPNKAFLRRNGLHDDGNMYKANYVGNGLTGQHDKHINRHTGHDDLVKLVDQLEKTKTKPDEQ